MSGLVEYLFNQMSRYRDPRLAAADRAAGIDPDRSKTDAAEAATEKALTTREGAAGLADSASTAAGLNAVRSPFPANAVLGVSSLVLKGASYLLAPPSQNVMIYDTFSGLAPFAAGALPGPYRVAVEFGLTLSFEVARPAATNWMDTRKPACPIPRKC